MDGHATDRRVAWPAWATALVGVNALLLAIFAHLKIEFQLGVPIALAYFGLAYGIRRGSRGAAVATVAAFAAQAAINLVVHGLDPARLLWMAVLGAVLWSGMRGVFARSRAVAGPA